MLACTWLLVFAGRQSALSPGDARLVSVAKQSIESAVLSCEPPILRHSPDAKPVFVTIEIAGRVRGCRGELETRTNSLEEEIAKAAKAASAHDPRYQPLRPKDLQTFAVTITIVDHTEPLSDLQALKPEDGLILRSDDHVGIVLPFEGKSPNTRLAWAYRKAGVPENSPVQLMKLVARRFRG